MLPADSPFAPLAAPGPHPAPADLRAYAAGKLTSAAEHDIEAHALDCERCADMLTGFSMSNDATTEQALVDVRQRLGQRVAELSAPVEAMPPAGFGRWRRLAAAAAVVAGLGVGWWSWQHPTPMRQQAEVAMRTAPLSTSNLPAPETVLAPVAAPPLITAPIDNVATAPVAKPVTERKRPVLLASVARAAPQAAPIPAADKEAKEMVADMSAARQADVALAPTGLDAGKLRADTLELAEVVVASAPATEEASARMKRPSKAKAAAAPSAVAAAPASPPVAGRVSTRDDTVPAAALRGTDALSVPRTRAALPPPPTLEPAPTGGYWVLRNYLRKQAEEFKPEDGKSVLHGTVRVRFTISAAGKPELEQAKFLRRLREDYDEEVLRMLEEGPTWIPGVAGGRRASLPVQVEVFF